MGSDQYTTGVLGKLHTPVGVGLCFQSTSVVRSTWCRAGHCLHLCSAQRFPGNYMISYWTYTSTASIPGTSAQSFPMQRGIRQGCSLAPLLFAIFTGWLYDQLSSRVGEDWAREFITMYADDSLLQWIILRVSDLEHMCKCIRETFSLLTATGMQVNAAKSQLVIQLQGPEAKRWLKQHLHRTKDGPLVSVGTPAAPIYIPRVQSFQYLGVIASLGGYELQTCRHRLKACTQVRHRLLRILHSSGLRLRQRVTLYQACVRSSMTYGIHAVGVTPGVLDRLEAQDAKHLRGLAKSPAQLWHESTVVLRARLKIRSVHQTLMETLSA